MCVYIFVPNVLKDTPYFPQTLDIQAEIQIRLRVNCLFISVRSLTKTEIAYSFA